jgi:CelD/BcsL family acetyltransferase involved in cellulose biosynthesis
VSEDPLRENLVAQAKLDESASCPDWRRKRLDHTVVRETGGFASLREEWDDLYRNCPSATPFSSWEWLFSWWEVYGEGSYKLRLITLRDRTSGLLVGLLPFMARRGRLFFLGDSARALYWYIMTPYKDVLVREGWEQEVAEAGARALEEMGGWRVADLQELMPHSAAWSIFRLWDGPKVSVPITDYVLIRTNSWDEPLSSLSKNARKAARKTLRRIEEDGVICEPAAPEDAERAASTLVELHRELWRGRRIDPEDLTPRYETFMHAAARRVTERGIGRVSEFRRQEDGEVLVSQFLLFDKGFVGAYVIGAGEEASRRYQFTTLYIWDAIEVARNRSSAYVSMMHHASWDKLRWASEVVSSHRAILGRRRAFLAPYAGYFMLRKQYYALRSGVQLRLHSDSNPLCVEKAMEKYYRLLSFIYSESAPRWIRGATKRYWDLRHKYGYGWLRYNYELARARRQIRRGCNNSQANVEQEATLYP